MKLFCKHIWKHMKQEPLHRTSERHFMDRSSVVVYEGSYYAVTTECVKCGKVKTKEEWLVNN